MANAHTFKPDLQQFELGGKLRTLKFDLNAYCLLEKIYGTVDAAMDALQAGSTIAVKNLLWAGLAHEEIVTRDELTQEPLTYNINPYLVGSWVTNDVMGYMTEVLTKALVASNPEEKEGKPLKVTAKPKNH